MVRVWLLAIDSKAPLDTVSVPFIAKLTPVVVVPDETVRLLNEVKIVVGKVFVAVNITVPVPGVQVLVPAPAPAAKAPVWIVPPAVILMVDEPEELDMVREVQIRFE